MRRIATLIAGLALLAIAAPAFADDVQPPAAVASWAQAQIEAVVAAGLMAPSVEEFRPDDALTRAELAAVLTTLTGQEQVLPEPDRLVTMWELNARLVRALGLAPAAKQIRAAVGAAGLKPPARLGTETVARLLGLRFNHPADQDYLELLPGDPATRAEAAFSIARILELRAGEADYQWVNDLAASTALPPLTDWQRAVLTRAVRFVGYPYVWGGTSEREETPFEITARGGFDCSGFVWRVFKTKPFADAPLLAETLKGRSTYEMSAEEPVGERIPLEGLQPGDVIFFGLNGPQSKPEEIVHAGIYLGGGWFAHSSRYGTTLTPLTDWYATSFAWGRRLLLEAGLQ